MKPHKHCEAIKAWAEGKQIQYKWDAVSDWGDWGHSGAPSFFPSCEYRVKPDTVRYRVALFNSKDGPITRTANSEQQMYHFHEFGDFDRWLTDWIEVEV